MQFTTIQKSDGVSLKTWIFWSILGYKMFFFLLLLLTTIILRIFISIILWKRSQQGCPLWVPSLQSSSTIYKVSYLSIGKWDFCKLIFYILGRKDPYPKGKNWYFCISLWLRLFIFPSVASRLRVSCFELVDRISLLSNIAVYVCCLIYLHESYLRVYFITIVKEYLLKIFVLCIGMQ